MSLSVFGYLYLSFGVATGVLFLVLTVRRLLSPGFVEGLGRAGASRGFGVVATLCAFALVFLMAFVSVCLLWPARLLPLLSGGRGDRDA